MRPFILTGFLVLSGIATPFATPEISLASLAYTRVIIEAVDESAPSLTFRTTEGEVWTLTASSTDILKGLRKGDTCSVELDLDDRVTKIVRVDAPSP